MPRAARNDKYQIEFRTVLSERDSLLVLELLENPPAPNAKLRAAIAALRRGRRKPIAKKD